MKKEYDLYRMKSRLNPYAKRLKRQLKKAAINGRSPKPHITEK